MTHPEETRTDIAEGPIVRGDRRTFLKRLAVVVPLGYTLSSTNAAACTLEEFADKTLAEEDAWRMIHHGPAHTGFNPGATTPEPPIEVKWQVSDFPGIGLRPVVVDDSVYAGTYSTDPPAGTLRAFSTDSGATNWVFVPSEPGVFTPAMVDGTIYIPGLDGNLNAVDVNTKEMRWTFETPAVPSFPKVTDDTVYITDFPLGSDEPSTVFALDAGSGDQQWQFDQLAGQSFTVAVSDGLVYVGAGSNVYAVDAATGTEQWRFEAPAGTTGDPAVAHDTVYFGSSDTNLYALNAATGEERWRYEEATGPFFIPAVDDGTVYVPNDDTNLYAFDATSGDQRWQFEAAMGRLTPAPLVGGETVYLGSADTNVYAVDTASGDERWRFEEATAPTTEPTPVGGSVYVGTVDGTLYALT